MAVSTLSDHIAAGQTYKQIHGQTQTDTHGDVGVGEEFINRAYFSPVLCGWLSQVGRWLVGLSMQCVYTCEFSLKLE